MKREILLVVVFVAFIFCFAWWATEKEKDQECNIYDRDIMVDVEIYNLPDRKYSQRLLEENRKEYRTGHRFDSVVWYDGEIVMKPINDKMVGVFWEGKLIGERFAFSVANSKDNQVMYMIGKTTQQWNLKKN